MKVFILTSYDQHEGIGIIDVFKHELDAYKACVACTQGKVAVGVTYSVKPFAVVEGNGEPKLDTALFTWGSTFY